MRELSKSDRMNKSLVKEQAISMNNPQTDSPVEIQAMNNPSGSPSGKNENENDSPSGKVVPLGKVIEIQLMGDSVLNDSNVSTDVKPLPVVFTGKPWHISRMSICRVFRMKIECQRMSPQEQNAMIVSIQTS